MVGPAAGAARAVARCDMLGVPPYSDTADGLYRGYLTSAHAAAVEAIGGWMAEAGMIVRLDAAANLVGRYEGAEAGAPALVLGSHVDSVRDAGRYDGPLGVMLGIELVARLAAAGRRPRFAVEVYAFGDEEGSRFPASMLCSRAVAGVLDGGATDVSDREGIRLVEALSSFLGRHAELVSASTPPPGPSGAEARWTLKKVGTYPVRTRTFPGAGRGPVGKAFMIKRNGRNPPFRNWTPACAGERFGFTCSKGISAKQVQGDGGGVAAAFLSTRRRPAEILAFVEPHIEQGPVLEAEGLAVGVVTGIAAQLRFEATVTGVAGHAGTTAMGLRRDALAAAAEMIVAVEAEATRAGGDVVATVGRLAVAPGAVNVVPGEAAFSIDVRAGDAAARDAAAAAIRIALEAIAARRGVTLALEQVQDLPASPCDPGLIALMDAALARRGQPARRLVSGAGHDTMVMAALAPTAMLFIRSPGGISHNPAERVLQGDVAIALDVLCAFVDLLEEDHLARTAA